MPTPLIGDRPQTTLERQQRWRERQAERAALAQDEIGRLRAAVESAYAILCAGKPPHSARENNARRTLRTALNR